VPYVRRQAAAVLALSELNQLVTGVELLLTDLVTNVVRHARTPFTVILAWTGRTLRCEVSDVKTEPPMAQLARSASTHEPDRSGHEGVTSLLGVRVTAATARRFLVARHFLTPARSLEGGLEGVLAVFRRFGSIQFDPIAVAGRNHDLVLHAASPATSPAGVTCSTNAARSSR
jgi:hypothetical protein